MAKVYVQEDGNGDYTTLAAAITANEIDIEIRGTWSADETAKNALNDDNRTIEATGDAKCPGYTSASPTHWRVRPTVGTGHTFIQTLNAETTIIGLEIKRVDNSGGLNDNVISMDDNLTVKDCYIWVDDTTHEADDNADGIYISYITAIEAILNVENCVFVGCRGGIFANGNGGTITINVNSSSFFQCGQFGTAGYKGCISIINKQTANVNIYNSFLFPHANAKGAICDGGSTPRTITCNIHNSIDSDGTIDTYDGSAHGCLTSHNITDDNTKSSDGDWVIVTDITSEPYDIRLQSNTYNEAQDMHTDGSGAGMNIGPDVIGTTRPQGTNYDCGHFEIVVAPEEVYIDSIYGVSIRNIGSLMGVTVSGGNYLSTFMGLSIPPSAGIP